MKGLYVIVDPEHCAGRDPCATAAQALAGGARVLQLRAKRLCDRDLLALARDLRARTRRHGAALWVNDRVDIALLAEADGVHLGQEDLPPHEARQLAPRLTLGISTHSLEQVGAAVAAGVGTIGFGPIFATQSKERASATVGVAGLAAVCAAYPQLEVIAIGGIRQSHAADLRRAGASYAAVISAVCGAPNPEAAARALSAALTGEGSPSAPSPR
jgi:thiamine-phosphate pyrophosphorylase